MEAKRNGKDFWGCDINPLAALIAQVKTHRYRDGDLARSEEAICSEVERAEVTDQDWAGISERIWYWFDEERVGDLIRLDRAIRRCTRPYSTHRRFFLCAFSAILKATSFWLTKSIKAQKDPEKTPRNVMEAFREQIAFMRRANRENRFPRPAPKTEIWARNFLGGERIGVRADLIVTSPPYVTSYNYADIHQLSTLWLGYASDYRSLRQNMLGNRHGVSAPDPQAIRRLGTGAWRTYRDMRKADPGHASSIASYFEDLGKAVRRCWQVLEPAGMAVFVIGNTQYKDVRVDNAAYLATTMHRAGFKRVQTIPRRISAKIMTPYRDARGRFTRDASQRQVYAEEFVLVGRRA